MLTFTEAMARYRASSAKFDALSGDDADAYTDEHFRYWDAVIQAQAPDGSALLIKLAMIKERYLNDGLAVPEVDWSALEEDISRLTSSTTQGSEPIGDDAEILAAWSRTCSRYLNAGLEGPAGKDVVADNDAIEKGIAVTPAGVAIKLRYALYCHATGVGMIAACFGADVPGIDEIMEVDGTDANALWTAIKSLEAMEARL